MGSLFHQENHKYFPRTDSELSHYRISDKDMRKIIADELREQSTDKNSYLQQKFPGADLEEVAEEISIGQDVLFLGTVPDSEELILQQNIWLRNFLSATLMLLFKRLEHFAIGASIVFLRRTNRWLRRAKDDLEDFKNELHSVLSPTEYSRLQSIANVSVCYHQRS